MSEPLSTTTSPLLTFPGAVPAVDDSPDVGVAWHYGDPLREQRHAETGAAVVDRSNRYVLSIAGAERLTWLHSISSQHVANLPDGQSAENLSLDLQGRIEHHFVLTDLGEVTWIDTEPTHGPDLLAFLQKMVFWAKAEPKPAPDMAVLTLLGPDVRRPRLLEALGVGELPGVYGAVALPGGGFLRTMPWPGEHAWDLVVPRDRLGHWWQVLTEAGAAPAGSWAFEALRVAALRPRIGLDTDDRTIPHEVRWIGGVTEHGAVHLDKGCYRGQETVARVHNLGKPPRHLVLLHLDGSADALPETGDTVTADGRAVGLVGTVVNHHELGPIALALVKRAVPAETPLVAGGTPAAIDADSVPSYDAVQAGRAAIDRLRGR
ncbi:YgfZ/GcvT domain-containing protein [Rhodococcus kronopolitis]|uniref:YgfZ/GcvT domain-containing protein n=1 Tax=Rhodococcus kronopolitis TaxID=1460226 RepID=A0ABV9FN96_9NOCA